MKGFYVYCVHPKLVNALPAKAKGVEFAKNLQSVPFQDIEAVSGEIDPLKFNPELIKEKLLSDPKWAEENICRHHEVIDRAFQTSVVIPMKFGTMYKNKKSLVDMLEKYYRQFKILISRLQDKKEWGIKAYLDRNKFIGGLKKKNKEIQKLEKRRSSVQEGMRWYIERKVDEIIAKEFEEDIEKELQYLIGKVENYTKEIRLNEILSKDILEPAREMIITAACLIKNDALQNFNGLFQELAKEAMRKGIKLELTGPWPPYNFVEIKNEKT